MGDEDNTISCPNLQRAQGVSSSIPGTSISSALILHRVATGRPFFNRTQLNGVWMSQSTANFSFQSVDSANDHDSEPDIHCISHRILNMDVGPYGALPV